MNQRLAEIRARRERLVAQSAVQRDALALLAEHWRAPFGVADHGLQAVRYARAHPGALLAAVAVLVALSPKRAFRFARRALLMWRGYRWAVRAVALLAR